MFQRAFQASRVSVCRRAFCAPVSPLVETTVNARAKDALTKSCYLKIDFKVKENSQVYDAMKLMAAHHIGCLAVTDESDKIVGVISERDYLCKVALLGRNSRDTKVSEICTSGRSNLVVANEEEDVEECMKKVLARDIRHLLISDSAGVIYGLLSIKDLVKVVVERHEDVVSHLKDVSVGGLSRREFLHAEF